MQQVSLEWKKRVNKRLKFPIKQFWDEKFPKDVFRKQDLFGKFLFFACPYFDKSTY